MKQEKQEAEVKQDQMYSFTSFCVELLLRIIICKLSWDFCMCCSSFSVTSSESLYGFVPLPDSCLLFMCVAFFPVSPSVDFHYHE